MIFNSFEFAVFFGFVFAGHWLIPRAWRSIWLLIASYIFYAHWDVRFLALIGTSTLVDYWAALRMEGSHEDAVRKRYLWISIGVNLSILGFFKYFNFFMESARGLLSMLGIEGRTEILQIALPLGISYYTFKTLSYTLDVYGRQLKPTRNLLHYAAYVAFFPQLLSGPIDRASALLPQIQHGRELTSALLREGLWLFAWGLFKKICVADHLAGIVDLAFSEQGPGGALHALLGAYAFTLQLYCDFSGYTDMARGIAMCLGFETAINFRTPFFATNPIDFWQRWHISLTQWIHDYIYIPLATFLVRRGGTSIHQYMAHLVTMVLIGIWHGARLTFVVFGVCWGLALIVYTAYRTAAKRRARRQPAHSVSAGTWRGMLLRLLSMAAVFHLLVITLVFFRADTLGFALRYIAVLFGAAGAGSEAAVHPIWIANGFLVMLALYFPVFLVQVLQARTGDLLAPLALPWPARAALFAFLALMLLMLGKTGGGIFIYQNF